jgi:tetrahydromethanopterin S-methyltransferase subunit B
MSVTINGKVQKTVLLTTDDVAEWEAELVSIREKIAELEAKAEATRAKLEAAALFMGGSVRPPTVLITQAKHSRLLPRPMTALVRDLFEEGVRLTPADVVKRLMEDPEIAERVSGNANNVYTALGRLANRDKVLTRHDDGAYTLTSEANEPPSGETAGGSGAGEGSTPSLSFQPQSDAEG